MVFVSVGRMLGQPWHTHIFLEMIATLNDEIRDILYTFRFTMKRITICVCVCAEDRMRVRVKVKRRRLTMMVYTFLSLQNSTATKKIEAKDVYKSTGN